VATNSANAPAPGSRLSRLANSPRAQRSLIVVSAVVLVVGLAAFVAVRVFHSGAPSAANPPTNKPQNSAPPVRVKPSEDAYKVAREFLETAVLRQNMHQAYTLVAAPLKEGISRHQWETGANQVLSYPAANARTATFVPISSTKGKLYMQLQLVPRAGSGEKASVFFIELTKQNGKWLVDYWMPANPYGVPSSQ
jgi:hypothetical protein